MLHNFISSISTSDKNPLSTQIRIGVRMAWAVKQHRDIQPKNWVGCLKQKTLLASDRRPASQLISALHAVQSTGLNSSWSGVEVREVLAAAGQKPWEVNHFYQIRPMLGLHTWDTSALCNHKMHALLVLTSSGQPSSSSTPTLSCNIFKLCPQYLNHPISPLHPPSHSWAWESIVSVIQQQLVLRTTRELIKSQGKDLTSLNSENHYISQSPSLSHLHTTSRFITPYNDQSELPTRSFLTFQEFSLFVIGLIFFSNCIILFFCLYNSQ